MPTHTESQTVRQSDRQTVRQTHSLTHSQDRKKPADALIKNPYNMVERLANREGERPGYITGFVAVKSLCLTQ